MINVRSFDKLAVKTICCLRTCTTLYNVDKHNTKFGKMYKKNQLILHLLLSSNCLLIVYNILSHGIYWPSIIHSKLSLIVYIFSCGSLINFLTLTCHLLIVFYPLMRFIDHLLSFPDISWYLLIVFFILSWYSLIVFYPFLVFITSIPGIHWSSFILSWHSLIVFYPFLAFIDRLLSFPCIHWLSFILSLHSLVALW